MGFSVRVCQYGNLELKVEFSLSCQQAESSDQNIGDFS